MFDDKNHFVKITSEMSGLAVPSDIMKRLWHEARLLTEKYKIWSMWPVSPFGK